MGNVSVDLSPVDLDPLHVVETTNEKGREANIPDSLVSQLFDEISDEVARKSANCQLAWEADPKISVCDHFLELLELLFLSRHYFRLIW